MLENQERLCAEYECMFTVYTVSQKNDTALACYNFDLRQPILILIAVLDHFRDLFSNSRIFKINLYKFITVLVLWSAKTFMSIMDNILTVTHHWPSFIFFGRIITSKLSNENRAVAEIEESW